MSSGGQASEEKCVRKAADDAAQSSHPRSSLRRLVARRIPDLSWNFPRIAAQGILLHDLRTGNRTLGTCLEGARGGGDDDDDDYDDAEDDQNDDTRSITRAHPR